MSDVSTMNHSLMCECGHVSGGHYYNPSLSGFDRCINCECKQFRLSCFEPTQTSPERAELQVSLLNEIGLTLTAVARAMAEQAETLKTYKLSLEGIQGLLVELEHSFDVIAEVQANSYDAVVTKFMQIEKRLAQIEEAIQCKCEMIAKFRGGYATDPSKCSIHGYPTLPERPVTVKRKPSLRPVSRKKRKR